MSDAEFSPTAFRVAARYVAADTIGNPQELLKKYDHAVEYIARDYEANLPKMREAEKVVHALGGLDAAKDKLRRDELPPHEAGLVAEYAKEILRYWVRVSLDAIKTANPWSLFLAILQQYDLPGPIRKTIETAAKFFAKTRIKAPEKAKALDAYENLLKTLRAFSVAAHDAIAHGKPRGAGGSVDHAELVPEKIHAGPFTLINTGGFKPDVIEECVKIVEVAAHQLQSHGLGKVCYGDVLISNTLSKPNVLAFYLVDKDEMFIRANLKGKERTAIQTVVHELGHRLQFKFLTGKKREIELLYRNISIKHDRAREEVLDQVWKDPHLKPKQGDRITLKGKEFEVSGFDVGHQGIVVKLLLKTHDLTPEEEKAAQRQLGYKIDLGSYAAVKGILPQPTHHTGFVTPYASTDADENFAEMIAFYCSDKLPEDQVQMLKAIIS